MGTYEELKAAIQQVIRTNGNNEITGALLQNALLSIVNVVGANATFAGIATPNTNPGTADQNVFYLATEAGTYVNFGGIEINMGEAVILSNKTGNWVKTTSGFATQQQLTELEDSIIKRSPNMFDGTYQNGYWGSSFNASTSYLSTNLIAVQEGVIYRYNPDFSTFGAQSARIALFDRNKALLYTAIAQTEGAEVIYTVPSGVAYVSCNIGKIAKVSTFIFAKDSEYPETYVPYGSKELSPDIKVSPDSIMGGAGDNILRNKKIALNGDSICYGAGIGGGYGRIIAERNGMTYENIAKSGGTISAETYQEGSPRHWISRTIENMSADADYVILEGGVNDSSLGVPLGQLSEGYDAKLDDTTFYGAFESMLKKALVRFSGKKIGYVIVHQMSAQYRAINDKEGSYYWAAKTCCEKWGIPYCDLNIAVPAFGLFKSESSPLYALRTTYTYNGDGWHPNEAGYKKYYCDKIESWMRTL